jgi:tetratricopeptide (TPR) repeat protein
VALDDLGRHKEAIKCFDTVIEIDPKEADAWSNKGVSFGLLGRFEKAVECFETAIKIDPLNALAWYNKGMTLRVLNCDSESEIALNKARELGYIE